jgi:uncharacterized membrane protein YdfJ with MMPL/SSD domain
MASTGPMILFSGFTVALALLSLCVFPQRFLYSIGLGGALVALTSAAVCLLLLPAVLALLGNRVNALTPAKLRTRPSTRRWRSQARFVLRHPGLVAAVSVTAMVLLSLPLLRVELTRSDATVLGSNSEANRAYSAVRASFDSDPASHLVVALSTNRPDAARVAQAQRALSKDPAVAGVDQPRVVGSALTRLDVSLSGEPFSDESVQLVETARDIDWGAAALVGGPSAELVDQRESLGAHIPAALGFIILSTALILFAMTRSVVIPLIALIMNGLTVSVAFGILVLVFQDGHLQALLDYTSQGALDTSIPILLFAVTFGLSTDYGIFLLQRIKEARGRTGSEKRAIATGLERSGRPITAAAILFAVAIGTFALSELVTM